MPAQARKQSQNAVRQHRREQQERKNRRNRLLVILSGVVLVAVAAVVLLINANRPPDNTPVGNFTTVPTQTWPQANGTVLGPANAKVVVQEFADYQCPICQQFDQTIQPQILNQYVKTGKIRYEFHNFIIVDGNVGGTKSQHAAEAGECANEQGRFWDYHEMLFANQGAEGSNALADNRLKAFAGALGLDTQKFNACFDAHKYQSAVNSDTSTAQSLGLNATPSVLVNGKLVTNPMNFGQIQTAIDAALNGS